MTDPETKQWSWGKKTNMYGLFQRISFHDLVLQNQKGMALFFLFLDSPLPVQFLPQHFDGRAIFSMTGHLFSLPCSSKTILFMRSSFLVRGDA